MTVTINGTTGITSPGGDVSTSLATGALSVDGNSVSNVNGNWRNRIINGGMVIDQRNAGASASTGAGTYSTYFLDRWQVAGSGGGVFSVQQSSVAPTGFSSSALLTVTTADSSIAAGDYYQFRQTIEGFNFSDLGFGAAGAQSVTVSFWVRSSLTGTFGGSLRNGAADRSYVFTYTVNAANTWEQKTVTITGDTTGTWATNNTGAAIVTFSLGAGATFEAAPGSWGAGSFVATSGAVDLVGTNGATFYITGVQLEAGSVATPFERRPYGTELQLCQRYYYQLDGTTSPYSIIGSSGGTDFIYAYFNPVTMRTTPTGTFTGSFQLFYFPSAGGTQTALTITSGVSTFTIQPSSNGGRFYTTRSVGQGGLATWADFGGASVKIALNAEI